MSYCHVCVCVLFSYMEKVNNYFYRNIGVTIECYLWHHKHCFQFFCNCSRVLLEGCVLSNVVIMKEDLECIL